MKNLKGFFASSNRRSGVRKWFCRKNFGKEVNIFDTMIPTRNITLSHVALYFIIKIIFVIVLISQFESFFSQSYFNYPDLKDNLTCNLRSHNGLFSGALCLLNITSIGQPTPILVAFVLNSARDLAIIFLAANFVSKRATFFLFFFFAVHPYLAIYHAKFTTDMFGSIAVAFVLSKAFIRFQSPILEFITVAALSGLRNSVIPMFGVLAAIGVIKNGCSKDYKTAIVYFLSGCTTVFFFFLPEELYSSAMFASTDVYPFSVGYFKELLGLSNTIFAQCIGLILMLLSHIVLLLGFREAVFTHFPDVFIPFTFIKGLQLSIFIGLFFVHAIGIITFFGKYLRKYPQLLILLLIVFPGFLFVAHLRYFLPLIPISLWGFAIFCDDILHKIKNIRTSL